MSKLSCLLIEREDDYQSYAAEFIERGTVRVPPGVIFSAEEVERIDAIQAAIPEESVTNGDAGDKHDIYVRRIMTDSPGAYPERVNRPFSDQIVGILDDEKRRKILVELLGSNARRFIRRAQMNRMIEGSYIGLHLDAASNPDYEFSMILQLGRGFRGGEFVVYPDLGPPQLFHVDHGSVLITTCNFKHEVRPVLANERMSLVYFYSKHGGRNRRDRSSTEPHR